MIVAFPSESDRWIDNIITFIYSSYFIYIIIRFVHKNYTLEKLKSEKSEKRLQQLNADKDLFISILGHDLKSPFQSILGLSEMLKDDIGKLERNEIETLAKQINTSAINSYNLLEEILLWAGTQQGKLPFIPQNISIKDIFRNVH